MAERTLTREESERRLWDAIEREGGTGMLGLRDEHDDFTQPMTAFVERDGALLWFFARDDNDLVRAVGGGARALFTVQYDKLQASIFGDLVVAPDPARRDRFWGPTVAAWYPEGRDDPHLTMLRLRCREARVWIAAVGALGFAWEIGKANLSGSTPDIGVKRDVAFDRPR